MIALLLSLALATEYPLVPAGSTWTFWDQGSDPGIGWNDVGYDDTLWSSGSAPLGYGSFGLMTLVDYGGDTLNRHITTWFRHEFTANNTSLLTGLSLYLRRDDGAVVYVNGTEVFRTNMPAGPITSTTLASAALDGLLDDEWVRVALDPSFVVDGNNVLAIEVHQVASSSSDLHLEAAFSGWDDAGAVLRGPYIQNTGDDSVTVRWRTEGPSSSTVFYGDSVGSLTQTQTNPALALDHEVEITGLGSNTTKFYGVGSASLGVLAGDDPDHVFTTAPPQGSTQPFRAWVLGDCGTANSNQEAVRDAFYTWSAGAHPDITLLLGDNAYNSGTDEEYQNAFFEIYPDTLKAVPFWSCIGNHDGYTASSLTQLGPYFDLFTFPTSGEHGGVASGTEAYFSFDYANVHFISLDSYGSDRTPGSPQLLWLEADLQATTADWVVAFWHHPAYSKGSHNSDTETQLVEMRQHVVPLLESYGVDLVLAGHSHSYERSYLLDQHYGLSTELDRAASMLDEGDGTPASDGSYRKHTAGMAPNEGAIYVTAGSSGKISGGTLDHPVMVLSTSTLGSVALDFDGDRLDAVFIDDSGAEVDRFAIEKGVATMDIAGTRDGVEGQELEFTASGTLSNGTPITSFDWNFGDGTPDVQGTDVVSHTWSAEADYRMVVTASDDAGQPFTEVVQVRIQNAPPVVDPLTPPASCDEGEVITWSGTASDAGGDPITYTWDFGDGTRLEGQQVDYALGDDGPHTVKLIATDDAGASGEAMIQVSCTNLDPVFQGLAHPPLTTLTPLTITALYTDPGRDDTHSVTWDVEGNPPGTGDAFDALFPLSGSYALTVTVTDDDGGEVSYQQVLTVGDGPPVLDDLAIPTGIGEGESAAMTLVAHEPGGQAFTTVWDFGDGTTAVGLQVQHTWEDDGVYPVTITLDDGTDDGWIQHVVDVIVDNRPAWIEQVDVPAGVEGELLSLSALVDDPGANDVLTVTWGLELQDTTGAVTTWMPWTSGSFDGLVSVTDELGAGETQPFVYTVYNAPPAIEGLPENNLAYVLEEWTYQIEASDPGHDPLTYQLSGPAGSWVAPSGVVHWIPDEEDVGKAHGFTALVRDDDGGASQVEWRVTVAERRAGEHAAWRSFGCSTGSLSSGWLAIGLALLSTRRRPVTRSP